LRYVNDHGNVMDDSGCASFAIYSSPAGEAGGSVQIEAGPLAYRESATNEHRRANLRSQSLGREPGVPDDAAEAHDAERVAFAGRG